MNQQVVVLERDCRALLVPHGNEVTLPQGSFVTVSQALGGAYTILVNGSMLRIDSADADALGFEVETLEYDTPVDGEVNVVDVERTLATIYDPEIPVNIVDLGLIYDFQVIKEHGGHNRIDVTMTLTAPGCGMGPVLVEEVKLRVARVPNVHQVEVELVFDPPWDRHRMTEAAQIQLGIF